MTIKAPLIFHAAALEIVFEPEDWLPPVKTAALDGCDGAGPKIVV